MAPTTTPRIGRFRMLLSMLLMASMLLSAAPLPSAVARSLVASALPASAEAPAAAVQPVVAGADLPLAPNNLHAALLPIDYIGRASLPVLQGTPPAPGMQIPPGAPGCTSTWSGVDLALVLDVSSSLGNQLAHIKRAASHLIERINLTTNRVALIAFGTSSSIVVPLSNDKDTLLREIARLDTQANTNIAAGITSGQAALSGSTATKTMIVVSDGAYNTGADPRTAATTAKSDGITIKSVSYASSGSSGRTVMIDIASSGSANFADAWQIGMVAGMFAVGGANHCSPWIPEYPWPLVDPELPCPPGSSMAGDPVSLYDLSWQFRLPCLRVSGAGIPINVSLQYNSRMANFKSGADGPGAGWAVSYSRRLVYDTASETATLYSESGAATKYYKVALTSNSFYGPETHATSLTRDATSGDFTLTYLTSGMQDIYGSDGYLKRVRDHIGNELTISRSVTSTSAQQLIINQRSGLGVSLNFTRVGSTWQLQSIADYPSTVTPVRTISLTYSSGRLSTIVDPVGGVHTFQYNATTGAVTAYYDPNNNPATLGTAAKATLNTYSTTSGKGYQVTRQTLPSGATLDFIPNSSPPDITSWDLQVVHNSGKAEERVQYYRHKKATALAEWGPLERLSELTNPGISPSGATSLTIDTYGNITKTIEATGRTTYATYGSWGPHTLTSTYYGISTSPYYIDTTRYTYFVPFNNPAPQLTFISNPDGSSTSFEYVGDSDLRLAAVTETGIVNGTSVDQRTTFETNSAGQVTATRLPDGTWNTQTYNSYGYPLLTTYDANYGGNTGRLALTEQSSYDARGRLLSHRNPQGVTTSYQYNNAGWLTVMTVDSATGGRAVRTEFTYDKVGNRTKVIVDAGTGKLNATWSYTYAPSGPENRSMVTQMTNPLGNITRFSYTLQGKLASVNEVALSRTTSYSYTPEGWLSQVKATDGRSIKTIGYGIAGNLPWYQSDARGVATIYSYDQKARVATISAGTYTAATNSLTTDSASTMTYSYDSRDRITRATMPNGMRTEQSFDGFGRLSWVRDALGNQTSYSYDTARNWLTGEIRGSNNSAEQLRTDYRYDAYGRQIAQIVDPGSGRLNLTTNYFYTASGSTDSWNLQRVQDPRGYTTTYRYNSLGKLSGVTDALNSAWSYSYNNLADLTGITPPLGAATTFGRDLLGRQTSLTRNGQTERWAYRADDTLASYTDFASQVATYSYDTSGRLTGIDRVGTNADATYTYLSNDLLSTVSSKPDGVNTTTISHTYDNRNRLTERSATPGSTLRYGYDQNNRQTSIEYVGYGTATYEYDSAGRTTALTLPGGARSTFSYRSSGLLATVVRPAPNAITTSYSYDTASRLTNISSTKAGTSVRAIGYTYDANSNHTSMTDQFGTATYQYDALNRVTQWYEPPNHSGGTSYTTQYSYSAVGNLTSSTYTTPLSYDASDRITNTGYTYDTRGNLTASGSTTNIYDAANRLTRRVVNSETSNFSYDGSGSLLRQTTTNTSGLNVSADFTLHPGSLPRLAGEARNDGSRTFYIYGPDGLHALKGWVGSTAEANVYPLTNALGSVVSLTNTNGVADYNARYDIWGSRTYSQNSGGYSQDKEGRLWFTGEQTRGRSSNDMIHLRARAYDTNIRRFVQRDSFMGFLDRPQSLNRYSYVENNPVNWVDPSGHATLNGGRYIPFAPNTPPPGCRNPAGYMQCMQRVSIGNAVGASTGLGATHLSNLALCWATVEDKAICRKDTLLSIPVFSGVPATQRLGAYFCWLDNCKDSGGPSCDSSPAPQPFPVTQPELLPQYPPIPPWPGPIPGNQEEAQRLRREAEQMAIQAENYGNQAENWQRAAAGAGIVLGTSGVLALGIGLVVAPQVAIPAGIAAARALAAP